MEDFNIKTKSLKFQGLRELKNLSVKSQNDFLFVTLGIILIKCVSLTTWLEPYKIHCYNETSL
jgi:hypothetical protein